MTDHEHIRMLELKLEAICGLLEVRIIRGPNQMGPDELVCRWITVPLCKECGK